jgi:stage II sporulation protein D
VSARRVILAAMLLAPLLGCAGKRPPVTQPGGELPERPGPEARPPEPEPEPSQVPIVRIGLRTHVTEARIGSARPFSVSDDRGVMLNGESGETYAVRLEEEQVLIYSENGELLGLANGTLRIVADVDPGEIVIDGARYPGTIEARRSPKGGLNVVNVLDVETYLRGVVPLEIGHAGDYLEAAKAQAVAARTYTAGHMGQYPDEGFDLEAGVQDQVYGSIDRRHADADRAVEETRGLILVHDGKPIRANYSSTCGGKSASLEEGFGAQGVPYLKSRNDEVDGKIACRTSKYFRWEETWTGEQLAGVLSRTVPAITGKPWAGKSIREIKIVERGASGRAVRLRIRTDKATYEVERGAIRRVLLTPAGGPLWSTAFELKVKMSGEKVKRLTAKGQGWGHGVGMCQWGAMQLSRDGHGFRDILKHYYPGARLVSWGPEYQATSGRDHAK